MWRIAADMPAKQAQVKIIRSTPSQVRPMAGPPAPCVDCVLMAGGLLPCAARPAPFYASAESVGAGGGVVRSRHHAISTGRSQPGRRAGQSDRLVERMVSVTPSFPRSIRDSKG